MTEKVEKVDQVEKVEKVEKVKQPYTFYVRILKPTLEKYGIDMSDNSEESIQKLRKMRSDWSENQFPPMKNARLLQAFHDHNLNDRAPVWMMRQAGRYLPEFMEISKDFGFFERCENPFLASEITLHPTKRFNIDAAIIFADILTLPKAMGMNITMEAKAGPVIHNPLTSPEDIKRLLKPDPSQLEHVYDALFLTRLALDGNLSLIGFCGAPWTVFAYMVEGGGSKLFAKAKKWLYLWKEQTQTVLDMLAEASAEYLSNCVKGGAQVVQLFDSWAGEIPQIDYLNTITPSLIKLATLFKKLHPTVPVIMFPRNACSVEIIQKFIDQKADDGTILFDGFNLDHSVVQGVYDLLVKENRTIQGNMEPGVLYGEDTFISERCQQMIKQTQCTRRYVVNLAHGLTPDHKPEKVKVFVDEVQKASEQKMKNM